MPRASSRSRRRCSKSRRARCAALAEPARRAVPRGDRDDLRVEGPRRRDGHGQVRARRRQDRLHPRLDRHARLLHAPGRSEPRRPRHDRLGDVVIAISNSGESDEILRVLPLIKRRGAKVIAITGRASSTLAARVRRAPRRGRREGGVPDEPRADREHHRRARARGRARRRAARRARLRERRLRDAPSGRRARPQAPPARVRRDAHRATSSRAWAWAPRSRRPSSR